MDEKTMQAWFDKRTKTTGPILVKFGTSVIRLQGVFDGRMLEDFLDEFKCRVIHVENSVVTVAFKNP